MDVRREERKKERMERCQELGIESMDRPFFILDELECGVVDHAPWAIQALRMKKKFKGKFKGVTCWRGWPDYIPSVRPCRKHDEPRDMTYKFHQNFNISSEKACHGDHWETTY